MSTQLPDDICAIDRGDVWWRKDVMGQCISRSFFAKCQPNEKKFVRQGVVCLGEGRKEVARVGVETELLEADLENTSSATRLVAGEPAAPHCSIS